MHNLPTKEHSLLTVLEAAQRSGMSGGGLRNALYRGKLPYTEVHGHKRIKLSDLDTYCASAKVGRPRKQSISSPPT